MQQPRDSSAAASPAPRPCHSQGNACHGGAQACSRARPLSPRPQAKAPSLCLPALSWARTRRAGRLWERASSQKSSFRAAAASCPRAGSQPPDSQKPLAEEPPAALPRSRGHREQERSRAAWPGGLRGGSPAPSSALPAAPCAPPGLEVRRRRGAYHGEGFPGLLEQRLGEQGDVHALGDVHCAAVQVCDNNVQLQGGDRHERGPRGANAEGARPSGGPREPQLVSSPFSASSEHSGLQQQLSPTQETGGKLGLREQQGRKAGRRGKKRDAALLGRLGPRSWLCGIRLLSWLRGLMENTDTDASPSSSTAPLSPNGTSQLVREAAQKLVSVWIRLIML